MQWQRWWISALRQLKLQDSESGFFKVSCVEQVCRPLVGYREMQSLTVLSRYPIISFVVFLLGGCLWYDHEAPWHCVDVCWLQELTKETTVVAFTLYSLQCTNRLTQTIKELHKSSHNRTDVSTACLCTCVCVCVCVCLERLCLSSDFCITTTDKNRQWKVKPTATY